MNHLHLPGKMAFICSLFFLIVLSACRTFPSGFPVESSCSSRKASGFSASENTSASVENPSSSKTYPVSAPTPLPFTSQFPPDSQLGQWLGQWDNDYVWAIDTARSFEHLEEKYPDAALFCPYWVLPGWIQTFRIIEGMEGLLYHSDGTLASIIFENHISGVNTSSDFEPIDGCTVPAYLMEVYCDVYLWMEEETVQIPEEDLGTNYWSVTFVKDGSDHFYTFFFSRQCFGREEVIAFAKTVQFEANAFEPMY